MTAPALRTTKRVNTPLTRQAARLGGVLFAQQLDEAPQRDEVHRVDGLPPANGEEARRKAHAELQDLDAVGPCSEEVPQLVHHDEDDQDANEGQDV